MAKSKNMPKHNNALGIDMSPASFKQKVRQVEEAQETQEVQETQVAQEVHEAQKVHEVQEVQEVQVVQEPQEAAVKFGSTQGRKGCKAKRINMAFSDENHEWIKRRSRQQGVSATDFVNSILDRERAKDCE